MSTFGDLPPSPFDPDTPESWLGSGSLLDGLDPADDEGRRIARLRIAAHEQQTAGMLEHARELVVSGAVTDADYDALADRIRARIRVSTSAHRRTYWAEGRDFDREASEILASQQRDGGIDI